ncbi:hypothetical protein SBOR_7647 [Sclerotinia borealis F-4128]|uniref:Uncharacterized protein n=1 Tax=Sclerotinia borealis (strain F-4128) TaxID=1432307 RepID=W9CBR1_SCLBF|nr:hypothetical protein SBOR_7647 [Sclerotinia borealis F-4128]
MAQRFDIGSLLCMLRSAAPYVPIPLYAESLRVKTALASATLTRVSVNECLSGCIKDLSLLWHMDDFEVFGLSRAIQQPFAVKHMSRERIRPGKPTNTQDPKRHHGANPGLSGKPAQCHERGCSGDHRHRWLRDTEGACCREFGLADLLAWLVFAMQITLTGSAAFIVTWHGMHLAGCLLLCITISNSITSCPG